MKLSAPRVWIAASAAVWFVTWRHQWHVWRTDPEYAYGFVVPLLVVFLWVERWLSRPAPNHASFMAPLWMSSAVLGALALCVARVPLEPFPNWTSFLWLQAGGAIAISVAAAGWMGGPRWAWHFLPPLLFALTGLPWPSVVHGFTVSHLMGAVAQIGATIVDCLGYPAEASGNIITVGRGTVGVDEACSGVRSLQATFMAALFLGEYLRFTGRKRIGLALFAILLAFSLNIARTVSLTWIAAASGPESVSRWHDVAGYSVLVLALGGLASLAKCWTTTSATKPPEFPNSVARPWTLIPGRPAWIILSVVILAEAGTYIWFTRPINERPGQTWEVKWPREAPSFAALPVTKQMRAMLHTDTVDGYTWRSPAGSARAGYFIRWPTSSAGRAASAHHTPENCLPSIGAVFTAERAPVAVATHAGPLVFRVLTFHDARGPFTVYHCTWDRFRTPSAQPTAVPDWTTWWKTRLLEIRHWRKGEASQVLTLAFWDAGTCADDLREIADLIKASSGQ